MVPAVAAGWADLGRLVAADPALAPRIAARARAVGLAPDRPRRHRARPDATRPGPDLPARPATAHDARALRHLHWLGSPAGSRRGGTGADTRRPGIRRTAKHR